MIIAVELLIFAAIIYWMYLGCPGAGIGAILLALLTAPRRREYLTAPAVVTAVEPVTYLEAKRWRVRFAYFDPHGTPQESADELVTAGWKPGDGCVAVFRPERPDIATFRPRPAA